MEGPITADCFDPPVVAARAAGAADAAEAIGVGVIGVGAGLRIGSLCGLTVAGSSFRLFHTWVLPPL
jgi:hypothetical protein